LELHGFADFYPFPCYSFSVAGGIRSLQFIRFQVLSTIPRVYGLLALVIGLFFAVFGIGGSAKIEGKLGTVSAGFGVILIIVGILFLATE
jgi:hypothetical protein